MLNYENIVPELLKAFPDLVPLYEEHLQDNDELLRHVFFGDVTRFVENELDASLRTEKSDGRHLQNVRKIVVLIETAITSGDPDLENLIGVSFVENLDRDNPNYARLRSLFGPALKIECRYWDGE